jgi:formylglycine-generating enzyme
MLNNKVVFHLVLLIAVSGIVFSENNTADHPDVPDGFVLVKAGTFTMGSPLSEPGRLDDEKQFTAQISNDFYTSKYEVTQGEYKSVVGSNPSDSNRGIGDTHPVNMVSWYDAVEYCNRLSERDGLEPCYSGSGDSIGCDFSAGGYRLPTEAEWEYAARGGQKAGSYNIYPGSDNIEAVGWYSDNAGGKSHPVGRKQPNELGIYDMSGNVLEWCWDRYGDYPSGSVTDPAGPSTGSNRVSRGGGWIVIARVCRTAGRNYSNQTGTFSGIGSRLVRTAK